MLLVNDHVLKEAFPGWWTGKASDVAGIAVIAVVTAVVGGPRVAIPVVAVAFTALKVVPGVAELAAPVLGGVTLRDPTDLLALAILGPVLLLLHRSTPDRSRTLRRRAATSTVIPLVGAVLAVGATTATSCAPDDAVLAVGTDGRALYALVETGYQEQGWASSTDGLDWERADEPADAGVSIDARRDPFEDPGQTGAQDACTSDGTCWRLRDRRVIERTDPDGTTSDEFELTEDEFHQISTGCSGAQQGVLASIAALDADGGPIAVASLGADGVLVRADDGTWSSTGVLRAPEPDVSPMRSTSSKILVVFGPALALLIWVVGRRRWPSWRQGVFAAFAGWIGTGVVATGMAILVASPTDLANIIGRVSLGGMVVTTIVAILLARERWPAGPGSTLPPPPPPPPR
ncbi:MAG: hypothetical protein KF906_09430 [Actinobacteria bacterium]|nr:hypothetical protein [Actinomycetota bacterium]